MAPSRRKGCNKAAAAVPARRNWKIGDLVLAKVKGFPAWPATVSQPEKWGYPTDQKKVLVQFFGSEQIAFCNPVDIEEFTEEKKVSLLGKRHGKGVDFVRAVNEIIDCFENLKKQDQVSRTKNATQGSNVTDKNKSQDFLSAFMKDEDPLVTVNPLSAGSTNDLDFLTEAAVAAAAEDAFENEDMMQLTQTPSSLVFLENRTYLTRIGAARSRNGGGSHRMKPARRIRSSSRIVASRLRSTTLSSVNNNNNRASGRLCASSSEDRSLRRIRRIAKSCDDSEGLASLVFVANDCLEEIDSRRTSVESDTLSIDIGSTEEPLAENNEGETELSDRLDFQSNNVVKKKRRPNRKRRNSNTIEPAKLNAIASDAEELRTECVSPSSSEKPAHRHAKDDGDEHLPLVKRARVRMGRSSAEEDSTSVHKDEKMLEILDSPSVCSSETLSCTVHAPPANRQLSPANKSNYWEMRKNSVDVLEAALPPSKRLHRALEAMSANVAEDFHRASICSPAANIRSNGYCTLSSLQCSEIGSGAREDLCNDDSLLTTPKICTVLNVERSENGPEAIAVRSSCCNDNSIDSKDPKLSSEQAEGADTKRLKKPPFVEVPAESAFDSVNVDEQMVNLNFNSPGSVKEAANESDPYILKKHSGATFPLDISGGSPNIDSSNRLKSANVEGDEIHKGVGRVLAESNLVSKMSEFVEEARQASLNSKIKHPVNPMKVLNNGNHGSLFHSTSVSYDRMEDRTFSATKCSSSLTDGTDPVALDKNKALENNQSYFPDVQLHLERAKVAGKSSSKDEALSSFETNIKSLTRTKESIARATRIAIDCARFGFATKVVEILTCNLENESNLHKKVDLFFLVDSITQCSRGMKGDDGVYPSVIQEFLPRLLLATAPPGSSSHENHRQCLKVLKVWQERKLFPEPIIHHHIRELDAFCGSYPIIGSNRTSRNERAFDDPIRQMDGMLVDEYGSNSSIQLPGFSTLTDGDAGRSDSDGESFEAVTPEHNVDNLEKEKTRVPSVEKRRHILEDVDGELEMEDVAPCHEDEINPTSAGVDQTRMPRHRLPPPIFSPAVPNSVSNGLSSEPCSSSQKFDGNSRELVCREPVLPRVDKSTNVNVVHHRVRENKDYEAELPRRMSDSTGACFSDRPTSRFSGRASNSDQPNDAFNKSFHLRPPYPAPSDQFSYVKKRGLQSWRDIPLPSRLNRFHSRYSDNGNFYRDRERNKFLHRDNIGEGWRPPYPSISGPCYPDGARMANAPMSYGGPSREPPLPHSRFDFPPRPMSHRHFDPYRPPFEGPIPVANRGPNYWRPR